MSPKVETFIRSLLTVVTVAVLTFLANATNLTDVVNPTLALFIASIAAAALAAWDKSKSPDGTVVFGSFGSQRYDN